MTADAVASARLATLKALVGAGKSLRLEKRPCPYSSDLFCCGR